jgi:hypothetical protein
MKYDDPFDVNPPFDPYISFQRKPISVALKTTGSKPKNFNKGRPLPTKKRVIEKQQTRPLIAPPSSKMMQQIMKAKELDTLIEAKRKRGERDNEFFELLDQFQKNSKDLENG